MDAHLFRRLAPLLAAALSGARLERIHEPLAGLFALTVFTRGKKCRLMFRPSRSAPLLYLTASPPLPNPAFPSAAVMRLRKYAEGRRLGAMRLDWVKRRMALALPGPAGEATPFPETWLLLDLKTGPDILFALPEDFGQAPPWPGRQVLEHLLRHPDDDGPLAPWRDYPILTPALRKTLLRMDEADAAALLVDLESAKGDIFAYEQPGAPVLSAWPLLDPPGPETVPEAALLLEAVRRSQEPRLLEKAVETWRNPAKRTKEEKKRLALRGRLQREKERLAGLIRRQEEGRLLQANLWRFPRDTRLARLTLTDTTGAEVTLSLDPLLTLTENMAAIFHLASRARRGLVRLDERLEALERLSRETTAKAPGCNKTQASRGKQATLKDTGAAHPWAEFLSSDGFLMLRGKSARGNHAILKEARPFDLWFHGEDGPSAHLILKKLHAGQEIPQRTLEEAAVLTALKSAARNDARAGIICALAKNVHPLKGAAPGTVTVRAVEFSLRVTPDPAVEARLRR